MTKKELTAFVYGAACGVSCIDVTETDLADNFYGLHDEMGIESYGRFISGLRSKFCYKGGGYADLFDARHLGKMETVPEIVEYIWEHRRVLQPWAVEDGSQ